MSTRKTENVMRKMYIVFERGGIDVLVAVVKDYTLS